MKITPKALLAAAAVLIVALTPSVSDCLAMAEDRPHHLWVLWLWIALAAVIALAFGETMVRS